MVKRKKRITRCYWCDRAMNHRTGDGLQCTSDHIIAKSQNGKIKVKACRACNELKADLHLKSWIWIITNVPQWWKLHKEQNYRGIALFKRLKAG